MEQVTTTGRGGTERRFNFHKHVFKLWLWPLSNPHQISCKPHRALYTCKDLTKIEPIILPQFVKNTFNQIILQPPSSAVGYLTTVMSWTVWQVKRWLFMVNWKEYGRNRISHWFLVLFQLPWLCSVCMLSTASNSRIIMNDVREIMWKEVVVAKFVGLSRAFA